MLLVLILITTGIFLSQMTTPPAAGPFNDILIRLRGYSAWANATSFAKVENAPEQLTETTPYKECVDYYSRRAGLSETKLALCTRENQQRLNKIARGQLKNVEC